MLAALCNYRDLYFSCSSFQKMGYLKMVSWAFELYENMKSFLAQGKFLGQHIHLFMSNFVVLTSAEVMSTYAVANLHKVFSRTKELYYLAEADFKSLYGKMGSEL